MPARYPIPADTHRFEGPEVQRSRFIATVGYATDMAEVRAFIDAVRAEFPDASHHCWACLIGPPGSTDRVACSDDGEPSGTAGRPMLGVLTHGAVGDVWAVVTRYFGGTKLGKGGLARAYASALGLAMDTLPIKEHIPRDAATAVVSYADLKTVKRLLEAHEVELVEERFELDVTLELAVPMEGAAAFEAALVDSTHGGALLEWSEAVSAGV